MEIVNLRNPHGIAKVVGIILSLAGAATIALYRGPHLKPFNHHHLLGNGGNDTVYSNKSWIKGSFLMLSSNILWGLWLVMQVKVVIPLSIDSIVLLCFGLCCFRSRVRPVLSLSLSLSLCFGVCRRILK